MSDESQPTVAIVGIYIASPFILSIMRGPSSIMLLPMLKVGHLTARLTHLTLSCRLDHLKHFHVTQAVGPCVIRKDSCLSIQVHKGANLILTLALPITPSADVDCAREHHQVDTALFQRAQAMIQSLEEIEQVLILAPPEVQAHSVAPLTTLHAELSGLLFIALLKAQIHPDADDQDVG